MNSDRKVPIAIRYASLFDDSFVGRSRELTQLLEWITPNRAVWIVGEAGLGKTRLLDRHLMERQALEPKSAGLSVDLSSLDDIDDLIGRMSLLTQSIAPSVHGIGAALARHRYKWIALDNLEHLQDGLVETIPIWREYAGEAQWYFASQMLPGSRWTMPLDRLLELQPFDANNAESLLRVRLQERGMNEDEIDQHVKKEAHQLINKTQGNVYCIELETTNLPQQGALQEISLPRRLLRIVDSLDESEVFLLNALRVFPSGLAAPIFRELFPNVRNALTSLRAHSLVQIDADGRVRVPYVVRRELPPVSGSSIALATIERAFRYLEPIAETNQRHSATPDVKAADDANIQLHETYLACLREAALQPTFCEWGALVTVFSSLASTFTRRQDPVTLVPLGRALLASLQSTSLATTSLEGTAPHPNLQVWLLASLVRSSPHNQELKDWAAEANALLDRNGPYGKAAWLSQVMCTRWIARLVRTPEFWREAQRQLREFGEAHNDFYILIEACAQDLVSRFLERGLPVPAEELRELLDLADRSPWPHAELLAVQEVLSENKSLTASPKEQIEIIRAAYQLAERLGTKWLQASLRCELLKRTALALNSQNDIAEANAFLEDLRAAETDVALLGYMPGVAMMSATQGVFALHRRRLRDAISWFRKCAQQLDDAGIEHLAVRMQFLASFLNFVVEREEDVDWAALTQSFGKDPDPVWRSLALIWPLEPALSNEDPVSAVKTWSLELAKNRSQDFSTQATNFCFAHLGDGSIAEVEIPEDALVIRRDASQVISAGRSFKMRSNKQRLLALLLETLPPEAPPRSWQNLASILWNVPEEQVVWTHRNRLSVLLNDLREHGLRDYIELVSEGYQLVAHRVFIEDVARSEGRHDP